MANLNMNVAHIPQHSIDRTTVTLGLTEILLGGVEIGVGRQRVDGAITQIGAEAVGRGFIDILYRPSETRQTSTGEQEFRVAILLFRLYEQGVYGAALNRVQNMGHRVWVNWIQPEARRFKRLFRRVDVAFQG
jgi:hypothetical protein